jgi:hypothetical protein
MHNSWTSAEEACMSRFAHLVIRLDESGEDVVRWSFADIETALLAPLPPSARIHAAYWSKGNNTGRVLAAAGWAASLDVRHGGVTFRRIGAPAPHAGDNENSSPDPVALPEPDLVLIGCVKEKRTGRHPARDLYTSALFLGRRARAEETGKPWFVLSSKFGLVAPDEIIETYDVALKELPVPERERWAAQVLAAVEVRIGKLVGKTVEVHAGAAYRVHGLTGGLRLRGARVVTPLEHLRQGEQRAWYAARYGRVSLAPSSPPVDAGGALRSNPSAARSAPHVDAAALVRAITSAFYEGALDLSQRAGAPQPGWRSMPECRAVEALRASGADGRNVRLFLTFVAVLNRARDADRLFDVAVAAYRHDRWIFEPAEVAKRSFRALRLALAASGLSQRHLPDTAAWRIVAESLMDAECPQTIRIAIDDGQGDGQELLEAVGTVDGVGQPRFPYLSGPKIAPLWVRMLAAPGGATLSNLERIPVAVDVQVRKVSEYLGLTATATKSLELARSDIQSSWAAGAHASAGPAGLAGTAAAVDPAVWFFGKWGCTFCESAGRKIPISSVCSACGFVATP